MATLISLGAGVQSSTMAMMAAYGEITPMPDAAIFADTGAEPRHVYEAVRWLEDLLPFPVYRVKAKAGSLRENVLGGDKRAALAPFFTTSGGQGAGMLRRQCTREYKIAPIIQKVRELVGLSYRQRAPKGTILAEQWIGISWDEMQRMKDPKEKYIRHRWPLIELRMTRADCKAWMKDHNLPEPKRSACTFCPYHDNATWQEMMTDDPESFEDACKVDEGIRDRFSRTATEKVYVHRSMIPLRDLAKVNFNVPQHYGQISFLDECDGMCGV